jgi:hypothetical protein
MSRAKEDITCKGLMCLAGSPLRLLKNEGIGEGGASEIVRSQAVDPHCCPFCGRRMRVIAVIEQEDVAFRIPLHLSFLPADDSLRGIPDDVAPPRA